MLTKIRKFISFALCVSILGITIPTATALTGFTDTIDHWASAAIEYVTERGYFKGTSDTAFSPDSPMTRAMFVTVLARLADEPMDEITEATPFLDVPMDAYYASEVAWAYQSGFITGTTPKHFSPDESITREQMFAILYRYTEQKGYDLSGVDGIMSYPDYRAGAAYAEPAIKWALKHEMYHSEHPTMLNTFVVSTRAEMAFALQAFDANIVPH